jgi:hypothetical protein
MVGLLPDSRSLEGGSDSDYLVILRYRLSARELPLIYADLRDAGCRAWQVQHGSDGPGRRIVRNCCCNRPNCLTCSPCSASSPTRPMKTASWPSQDAYRFTADRIQWNSEKTSATPFNGALVSA